MVVSRFPKVSTQSPRAVAWATVMGGSTRAASVGPWIRVWASGDQYGASPVGSAASRAGSSPETRTSYWRVETVIACSRSWLVAGRDEVPGVDHDVPDQVAGVAANDHDRVVGAPAGRVAAA